LSAQVLERCGAERELDTTALITRLKHEKRWHVVRVGDEWWGFIVTRLHLWCDCVAGQYGTWVTS